MKENIFQKMYSGPTYFFPSCNRIPNRSPSQCAEEPLETEQDRAANALQR